MCACVCVCCLLDKQKVLFDCSLLLGRDVSCSRGRSTLPQGERRSEEGIGRGVGQVRGDGQVDGRRLSEADGPAAVKHPDWQHSKQSVYRGFRPDSPAATRLVTMSGSGSATLGRDSARISPGMGKLRPVNLSNLVAELEEMILRVSQCEKGCVSSIFSVFPKSFQ